MNICYNNIKVNKQFINSIYTRNKPKININLICKNNKYYTLVMNDPNAPIGNYIHWVIINLVCNNNIITLENNGITLVNYKKPSPPKNSNIHNYIFSLYEQDDLIILNSKLISSIPNVINNIDLLNLIKISKKTPIVSNYFISYFTNNKNNKNNKNNTKKIIRKFGGKTKTKTKNKKN